MVINVLPGNCDLQNFATNNSKLVLFLPGAYSLKFILMLYHYLFICHVNSSHMTFWTNQLTQSKTVPPTATAEIQNVHSLQLLWDHQSTTIVPTGEISKKNLLLRVFIAIIWQRHFILSICTGTALGISKAKFKWWL